jgi:hypothetical protein
LHNATGGSTSEADSEEANSLFNEIRLIKRAIRQEYLIRFNLLVSITDILLKRFNCFIQIGLEVSANS